MHFPWSTSNHAVEIIPRLRIHWPAVGLTNTTCKGSGIKSGISSQGCCHRNNDERGSSFMILYDGVHRHQWPTDDSVARHMQNIVTFSFVMQLYPIIVLWLYGTLLWSSSTLLRQSTLTLPF